MGKLEIRSLLERIILAFQSVLSAFVKRLPIALILSLAACSAASSAPRTSAQVNRASNPLNNRTYVVHTPNNRALTRSVPLVIIFHGYGGQGKDLAQSSGLNQLSDRENFVVAYPDGLNKRWNVAGNEDVAFTNALISQLQQRYKIDSRRVYVAGISNGGFLAQRLACEYPNRVAAFASVVATVPGELVDRCRANTPTSMLMINGTDDRKVPWNGGFLPYGQILSVPNSISYWRQRNRCAAPAQVRSINPRVQVDQYRCQTGTEVELVTLKGVGHLFPRGGGGANSLIDASSEIWQFFQRHRLS